MRQIIGGRRQALGLEAKVMLAGTAPPQKGEIVKSPGLLRSRQLGEAGLRLVSSLSNFRGEKSLLDTKGVSVGD